jgi:hypothetical protein
MVTLPSSRRASMKKAADVLKPRMRQRIRTGRAANGAKDHDWAMIEIRPDDTPEADDPGHAILLLRGTATPEPSATTSARPRSLPHSPPWSGPRPRDGRPRKTTR